MTVTRVALLTFLRRLEDDPRAGAALMHGSALFDAAVAAGIVNAGDQDAFARVIGRLIDDRLVRFETTNGGHTPLPPGALWNGFELQSHGGYGLTGETRPRPPHPNRV